MTFFFIFVIEILLLFFLSRFVTRAISSFFYHVSKKEHLAVWLLAILFFPGTLLHELAHFFMAVVLFVRVGDIEFIPKIRGESVKLGSVGIGKSDPFRRALIGLAPMFVGLVSISYSMYYFSGFPLVPWYVNIVLMVGIVFEIGNTMFSSPRDVEGLLPLVLTIVFIVILGSVAGVRVPQSILEYISSEKTTMFFYQLCLYMSVPVLINGAIVLVSKTFKK